MQNVVVFGRGIVFELLDEIEPGEIMRTYTHMPPPRDTHNLIAHNNLV